jgi:hypothetical protein
MDVQRKLKHFNALTTHTHSYSFHLSITAKGIYLHGTSFMVETELPIISGLEPEMSVTRH